MMNDQLPSAWFYRLKSAQRDLIKRVGGIERAAEVASVSKSQMGRFNNDGDPEMMPVPVALMLQRDCDVPFVTAAMAELEGRRLADPNTPAAASACIMARHAEVVARAAELMAKGAYAFSDNRTTPAEAAGLDRSAAALLEAISDFRIAAAAARAGEEGSTS